MPTNATEYFTHLKHLNNERQEIATLISIGRTELRLAPSQEAIAMQRQLVEQIREINEEIEELENWYTTSGKQHFAENRKLERKEKKAKKERSEKQKASYKTAFRKALWYTLQDLKAEGKSIDPMKDDDLEALRALINEKQDAIEKLEPLEVVE